MTEQVNPNAMTPSTLALLLTNAGKRLITEQQVREIAEQGELLSADDTVNLIQYAAFLAKESEGKNFND